MTDLLGIHCPSCGSTRSGVIRTIDDDRSTRRRRKCKACGEKFWTYEFSEADVPSMDRLPRETLKSLRAMALRIVERAEETLKDD